MQATEDLIRNVVQQVLSQMRGPAHANGRGHRRRHGVFTCVNEAVTAAGEAFEELSGRTIEDRKRIIDHIRRISIDQSVELGTMEMNETKIGRLEHKIEKLKTLGERTPGVEFMRSEVFSGDHGLAVIEHAPFGVIGAITPGDALAAHHHRQRGEHDRRRQHAGGQPAPQRQTRCGRGRAAIQQSHLRRPGHRQPGLRDRRADIGKCQAIFKHRDIALICVTGGPAVARAALNSGKRAIVAGPGNPPVVVDETADLDRAARSIIKGAAYDNNLLCIAEKEVFVVEEVFDAMLKAMDRAGAVRLNAREVDALTKVAITQVGEGEHKHDVPAKEYLGQDAAVLARGIGKQVPPGTELLFGETDESNPFVPVEQMMPFVPFVRCRDVDEAIAKAKYYEHGFRHTSMIHSNNVRNMTKMGRVMDTTLFVKNGPCMASLGLGGEGYLSFSIATPTGEGVTTPLTFTRERRCSLIDDLRILGKA